VAHTPLWQFWLNFAVGALGALATLAAVLVALFRDWLLYCIARPKPHLALVNPEGRHYLSNRPDQSGRTTDGFWYHVRVENNSPWNPVSDLYVFLLSIEQADAAGDWKPVWNGDAALTWRHEANPQPKKIGIAAECDLCHLLKEPLALHLSPIIPISLTPSVFPEECRIALTLQAKGVEATSPRYRFEIFWNGEWSDDATKRARNLVIKTIQLPQ
jgi:hypothetical protein